jgi:hypothetical protein
MGTFSIDDPERGDKFIGSDKPKETRGLQRPIFQALEELEDLLMGDVEVNRDKIQAVVSELEAGHDIVWESFGVCPQHEGDAAGTVYNIRKALSDTRLKAMGIVSRVAFEEEKTK